jgi:hypothetical protein
MCRRECEWRVLATAIPSLDYWDFQYAWNPENAIGPLINRSPREKFSSASAFDKGPDIW